MSSEQNPIYSPFFGVMGATSAMVFSGEYNMFLGLGTHNIQHF